MKANLRITLAALGVEHGPPNTLPNEDHYTEDIVRIEHIRPQLLLTQGQENEQDVIWSNQLAAQIESCVSELNQVSRIHRTDKKDIHVFFKSLRDVTLLVGEQFGSSSCSALLKPFELETIPKPRISLPIVRLAEECLEGERDGLYEVYCGISLMRSLVSSKDHVETFNEEGTEKVLGIVVSLFKGAKTFCPALVRYRASLLLLELLSYAQVADKVLGLSLDDLDSAVVKLQKEKSSKDGRQHSRSRSRSKDLKKKDDKRRHDDHTSSQELDIL